MMIVVVVPGWEMIGGVGTLQATIRATSTDTRAHRGARVEGKIDSTSKVKHEPLVLKRDRPGHDFPMARIVVLDGLHKSAIRCGR